MTECPHLGDGGEQAATVLSLIRREAAEAKGGWSPEEDAAFKADRAQYEAGNALCDRAAVDDGIIIRRHPCGARPGARGRATRRHPSRRGSGVFRM